MPPAPPLGVSKSQAPLLSLTTPPPRPHFLPFPLGAGGSCRRWENDASLCAARAGGSFAVEPPDAAPSAWRAGEGRFLMRVAETRGYYAGCEGAMAKRGWQVLERELARALPSRRWLRILGTRWLSLMSTGTGEEEAAPPLPVWVPMYQRRGLPSVPSFPALTPLPPRGAGGRGWARRVPGSIPLARPG